MSSVDRRWPAREYIPAACVGLVAGLLHRRAAVDAWADDRSLAADPLWMQMAAPQWHAAVADSPSITNWVLGLLDPLTSASPSGDLRALAAIVAALSAGVLWLVLRRAGVRPIIAAPLCGVTVASLLPVAPSASVSHALLMLLGTALILTWPPPFSASPLRLGVLAAITALGGLTHAAFLAFAAGIWCAECLYGPKGVRARVALVAVVVLAVALLLSSWMLARPVPPAFDMPVTWPNTLTIATGLVTGGLDAALQPSQTVDWRSAIAASVPAPAILAVPLALLAFARRETRGLAVACGLAFALLVVFLWESWLPDPAIAGAPARLAVAVLLGLGLSWVADQPGRGALTLAVLASVLVGARGFVEPTHWSVPVKTRQLQAFVESAPAALDGAAWSVDRLGAARALLSAHSGLAASRIPVGSDAPSTVPLDRPVVTIGSSDRQRMDPRSWYVPFDISYPSAERFLAAQPDRLWMTVAVRGGVTNGFCSDLVSHLNGDSSAAIGTNPTLLARIGKRPPRTSVASSNRLDVEYGRELAGAPEPVPARISIEASEAARIVINQQITARADRGMAIATFDPWTADTEPWIVGPCDDPTLPAIRDRRLAAAHVVHIAEPARRSLGGGGPRIPALGFALLQVRLDANDWFGSGWHGPEGQGENAFRWTGASEAHVNVAVARPQAIRVRMTAALASAPGVSNALGLSWNGTIVRPISNWSNGGESEWMIPASLVARGMNVFTIHVASLTIPAESGRSSDPRALGAVVSSLSFEPIR